ncbi:Gfo/Idh/MocA family protein [Candidatus Pelagibacter bacterium nBUS_33]|uniref:Gfo/Idh/MocA family protein n=1 Tax=Candidatus Pelagibacter bacterium nBUS_33 TaxID=3374193 RepID=UPI003EBEFCA0
MEKYKGFKIGVIGCGYWATNIIKTLENLGLKNIFIFDKDLIKINLIKKKFNFIKVSKDIDSLLSLNLDCYFLITPASTHYKIAKKIITLKKDIFIEKPATLNSKNIDELIKISKKNKNILMSGYIYNYNVYINYIKKILKKNTLGKIKYMYLERCNLGPIRNDTSCIWDLASHDISTSFYLLGKKPKINNIQVYNFLKKDKFDISNITLDFNKIKVEIKSSWLSPEKTRKLIIIGEKKMLQFDEISSGNKIRIYNKYASYYPDILKKYSKKHFTPFANIKIGKTFEPKIKFSPPLEDEVKHFLNSVLHRKKPITDGNYAKNIIKIIENIEKKII